MNQNSYKQSMPNHMEKLQNLEAEKLSGGYSLFFWVSKG